MSLPKYLSKRIDGVDIVYPADMFRSGGGALHRHWRSQFLRQMQTIFDTYAEEARQFVIQSEPDVEHPELSKLGDAMFSIVSTQLFEGVHDAFQVEEPDESSILGSTRPQDAAEGGAVGKRNPESLQTPSAHPQETDQTLT